METKIKINTQEGQNSFITNKIKGFLDAVIINTDQLGDLERVQLIIESELGYLILKRSDIKTEYLAPRTRAVTHFSDAFGLQDRPGMDKFNLNEKLIITVMGPKSIDIELILRIV